MRDSTRETMTAAVDFFQTVLNNNWYTDSAHDEFSDTVDHLRWAYECEEAEMDGQEPPTFKDWFLETFGHPYYDGEEDEPIKGNGDNDVDP